jgi:serine/threonine-protein kinase
MIYRPGQCIDHYQITRVLGQGAASHVYLAQDLDTGHDVVLKFPSDDLIGGAQIFARYLREAEVGRCLSHPAIQQHLNQGETRSANYLVLEYLDGRPLRVLMQEHAPALLPQEEVLRFIGTVCAALVYAHAQGVVHRDIKPENIMILETGEVKLIDFGIAFLEKEPPKGIRRGFLELIGTPTYMSPERLRGKPGDARSDIYAVGVVLYELLSGRTHFAEQDGFAFVNAQVSYDPPDILQACPTLSPALATVVMRAIRRNPHKRYTYMQDLLDDLHHLEKVVPVRYIPDLPLLGGQYRQIISLAFVIIAIFLVLVTCGLLGQFIHSTVH